MMKRFLSLMLVILMMLGMLPTAVFAAEEDDSANYITVSIEVHDADGSGRFLLNPKRLLKQAYTNDYVIDALVQAMGSTSFVNYSSQWDDVGGLYSITGIYDPTQEDSFLNNEDLEGCQWQVLVNNAAWSGRDWNANYKLRGGDVVRCVFTSSTASAVSQADKDALIQLAGKLSGDIWYESDSRYPAYRAALDTIVDQNSTQSQVDAALAALQNALVVDAQSVEITAGESMELGLNKSTTLQATVLPADTTDMVVWSTSDSSIVSVDSDSGKVTGLTKGTATVTVTAGSVSDSILITVAEVAAEAITITTGDVSVEARFSAQLEAVITPEYSTDLVAWSVEDESIAMVDANGLLTGISVGTTTVTATAGSVSDTIHVTVLDTTSPYIYFQYADGRVQEMKNDTFTLTALDEGTFLVGNLDSTLDWNCSEYVSDGNGGYEYRYWISSAGKYQPHGAKKMTATVSGTGYSKTFYINTVASGITQIKAYISGEEVNAENPYEVTGMVSNIPITVQGLNRDNQWVYIPVQAVNYESSHTNVARINGNQMNLIAEGRSQISVSMVDNSAASVSFDAVCGTVMVTGIDVKVPTAPFVIDKWDSMGNAYIGITMGYEDPNTEYHVVYTPSNATNQNLIWTDLTPEIAEFQETHSAGIVPKKSGTARFLVTSEANPKVSQEVSVTFVYKTPLESAVIEQNAYSMNVGDSITPNITFAPSNATETRFNWTYSQNGIVRVTESITSDTYNRYITRKIVALANGTVTVTGTPIDDTAGCKPIVFTVTVGGSGETETVDYLKIVKEDIAHGLRYLSTQNQTSFGNEWTIFTNLRAGGFLEMQMQIIYLQNAAEELNNYAEYLAPTDYARLVLTLPLLGVSPESFEGHNLVEALYNNQTLESQTSNQISWALLALDSRNYDIPEDALWTREKLLAKILTFQASDGSFSLSEGSSGSVDMTGMILQALAPYYHSGYPEVQSAVNRALVYLKEQMNENVGYIAEGGENGCTAAQVLTALAVLKIDPTDPANGFTLGTKNLITNLDSFRQDSGFAYLAGQGANVMGTQQITYAMEAYRRYAEGQDGLYDLTDIKLTGAEKETYTIALPTGAGFIVEAANGSVSPVEEGGSYSFTVTVSDGYIKSSSFVVKANGTVLTGNGGVYTIENITANQAITVEGVVQEAADTTAPVIITSGGENCTVTSIGDRTYTGAFGDPYTLPFYTVRVRENVPFVITKDENGDGANGSSRVFANIEGYSYSGNYPYTMDADQMKLYILSTEQFVSNFGSDTGLNTGNTVAFMEVKFDSERLFGLLVELVPAPVTYTVTLPTGTGYIAAAKDSTSPVEQGGSYRFTISINESFEKSDRFAVKANGAALTEQNGTYTINNITEDQIITVEGVVAKPTTSALTVTADGENCVVAATGLTSYKQGDFGTVSGVPVYRVSVPENADFVVNWNLDSDGGSSEGRYAFSIDAGGDMGIKYYPFTMRADSIGDYILDAKSVTECFGENTGLNLDNRIAFLEVYNSNLTEGDGNPLYGLLVEFTPVVTQKETYTVSLTSGTGYTVKAAEGSTSPVEAGGSFSFTVTVSEGYEKGNGFAVKANGTVLTEVGGKYTIQNISENLTITVTGITKKAETITVRFSLLGCYKHSEGETAVHTLAEGNLQTWISAKRYEVSKDATVKDLLELALSNNGMSCGNPTGNYVKYITRNGVRIGEFTNGSLSGWMYTLNGAHSSMGVAEQKLKDGDVIIFHYTDDYTRENGSSGYVDDDEKAANAAEKLIDAIGTVTLNSADEISAARKAYDALTYTQKQLVDNYAILTAAEAQYADLKKTDNEKKAAAVENMIGAIKEGSTAFENDVKAAQKAYNSLSADQKKLVDNYYKLANYLKELAGEEDKEAAEAVETLIEDLGTIQLDSEEAIKAAREAYNKLTDEQKLLVENLSVLEAAEERLADLKVDAVTEDIYRTTGDYLEDLGTPVSGSVGGEWMVIGLNRSGREISGADEYYASVVSFVQENIDENARLHSAKSSENSRIILALTALGKDVTDVAGHNLLNGLNNMAFVQKQGINGPIWALVAFDSGNYPVPEGDVTREALIQIILDAQLADGGWALSGEVSDADMTGMAVQALAPYYEGNANVKKALDEAIETMSKLQNADGSYGSIDGTSSESAAQIIVALAALGIDADKDPRFIKNSVSAVDALCAFYVEGGGFKHLMGGSLDGMATEQCYYALAAYFRMLDGKTSLYDMTDVVDLGGDVAVEEPSAETMSAETEPAPADEDKGGFPWWVILVVLIAGVVIAILIPATKKRRR